MATLLQQVYVGRDFHNSGAVINLYDTYAHALARGSTGLVADCETMDPTDGTTDGVVTQVAGTTGWEVDQNGFVHLHIITTSAEVFLMATGQFGPPRRIQNAA